MSLYIITKTQPAQIFSAGTGHKLQNLGNSKRKAEGIFTHPWVHQGSGDQVKSRVLVRAQRAKPQGKFVNFVFKQPPEALKLQPILSLKIPGPYYNSVVTKTNRYACNSGCPCKANICLFHSLQHQQCEQQAWCFSYLLWKLG